MSTTATVFIANVPYAVTNEVLKAFLDGFANVVKVRLAVDDGGRSRGYAFVSTFSSVDTDTLLELDGYRFNGRELRVEKVRPKQEKNGNRLRTSDTDSPSEKANDGQRSRTDD